MNNIIKILKNAGVGILENTINLKKENASYIIGKSKKDIKINTGITICEKRKKVTLLKLSNLNYVKNIKKCFLKMIFYLR